ncbi:hypothetical protein BDA99DRAFT_434572 [Phascolomyces articulosus]|uniref:Uncharacterized protein n=1 Tax=Phascolomyces articulosus TaxID=60185 RepID=A0AAD5K5Z6_9FUNG|nr:hypothetical protein BDA99DRAFT_434572 [Phascolomyces articulosus]
MKIRHKVVDMYAISLVDPKTFAAYAETHCESATTRSRSIVLHCGDEKNKKDFEVVFKETGVFVFEWCFEWAGEKYRWYAVFRKKNFFYHLLLLFEKKHAF